MALLCAHCNSDQIKLLCRWHLGGMMYYLHQEAQPFYSKLCKRYLTVAVTLFKLPTPPLSGISLVYLIFLRSHPVHRWCLWHFLQAGWAGEPPISKLWLILANLLFLGPFILTNFSV